MKTIIVNVPDKDENLFSALVAKLGFKTRTISKNEIEEVALAKWIEEGMQTKDVSEKEVFTTLRKHGIEV